MNRRSLILQSGALVGANFAASKSPAQPRIPLSGILEQTGAPALAGAVLTADGPIWLQAFGKRRQGSAEPVTPQDRWHLGSQAKAITCALYARLVEAGALHWSARLPELFPELPVHRAWRDITIEQAMSQTAGVRERHLFTSERINRGRRDPRPLASQRTELLRLLLAAPPSGAIGEYEYANLNFTLVAGAVERVMGGSVEHILESKLFRPLDMSVEYGPPRGDHPWGHRLSGSAEMPLDPASPDSDNPPFIRPAGGMNMTLVDYAKFLRIYLAPYGFLRRETLRHLLLPVGRGDRAYAGGWLIGTATWASGLVLRHEGSNGFWHARATVAPDIGRAFVAVSNAGETGAAACEKLTGYLIGAFRPK
jgi:CubicO group peptidase (beta-lactamase class C family)